MHAYTLHARHSPDGPHRAKVALSRSSDRNGLGITFFQCHARSHRRGRTTTNVAYELAGVGECGRVDPRVLSEAVVERLTELDNLDAQGTTRP